MEPSNCELLIVLPVFNEEASVRKVVVEWIQEVENWSDHFLLLVINDGSTDGTAKALNRLKAQFGDRLEIHERENRGHGQSCLEGYRIACERGIEYVFQIDSDGQCDPQYFFRFGGIAIDTTSSTDAACAGTTGFAAGSRAWCFGSLYC